MMKERKDYFKAVGANIYFEIKGEGECILFLHAGIADSRMWENEYRALSKSFCVVRLDLPGYGFSEFTGGKFSYNDILNGLLKHLNIEKVHIIGSSFGGKLAIDFALANKDKCLSLVLASAALSGWEDSDILLDYGVVEEKLFEEGKFEEVAKYNFDMWVLRGRPDNYIDEKIKGLILDMQMKALTKTEPENPCEEIEEEDNLWKLKNIKIPVLVIVGEFDVPDFQEMANIICEDIPSCKKVVIENASHLTNLEYPCLFEEEVLKFLK